MTSERASEATLASVTPDPHPHPTHCLVTIFVLLFPNHLPLSEMILLICFHIVCLSPLFYKL